jgi:hypothetical protein
MDVAEQRFRLLFVTDEGVQRQELVGATDEFTQLFWQEFWVGRRLRRPAGHRRLHHVATPR